MAQRQKPKGRNWQSWQRELGAQASIIFSVYWLNTEKMFVTSVTKGYYQSIKGSYLSVGKDLHHHFKLRQRGWRGRFQKKSYWPIIKPKGGPLTSEERNTN